MDRKGRRDTIVYEDRDAPVGVEAQEPILLLLVGPDVLTAKWLVWSAGCRDGCDDSRSMWYPIL